MEAGNTCWVLEEIQRAIVRGISVRVDGICSLESVENTSRVHEEVTYMEDYIGDEEGRIIEISFSRVKVLENTAYSNHIENP